MGTHLKVLSESYLMSTNMTGFRWFSKIFACALDENSLSIERVIPYAAGGQFGQYQMMEKSWKIIETLANGYSYDSARQELSNEYQHDRVKMIFTIFAIFVHWRKVTSASEGLCASSVQIEISRHEEAG